MDHKHAHTSRTRQGKVQQPLHSSICTCTLIGRSFSSRHTQVVRSTVCDGRICASSSSSSAKASRLPSANPLGWGKGEPPKVVAMSASALDIARLHMFTRSWMSATSYTMASTCKSGNATQGCTLSTFRHACPTCVTNIVMAANVIDMVYAT